MREKKKEEFENSDLSSRAFDIKRRTASGSQVNLEPKIKEVKTYFQENNFPEQEAQKFFNYFKSVGWLVGGRTKMKDWKAAARNWMLNSKKFSKNENKNSELSVRAESRTINLNPKHLHVTNQKNYGEAL